MTGSRFTAVVLLFAAHPLAASGPETILLPSSRRASTVLASERNPFAKREEPKVEQQAAPEDAESEERRISDVLTTLEVVGRTRGDSGWKVLLGDLILQPGTVLPPVIEGQTQKLRVVDVYDASIEIEWIDDESGDLPRRLFIPVNLTPGIRSTRPGMGGALEPAVVSENSPVEPAMEGANANTTP